MKIPFSILYRRVLPLIAITLTYNALAQQSGMISGRVTDENEKVLDKVNISIPGSVIGTNTDADGIYYLSVPAGKTTAIVFSYIGFRSDTVYIKVNSGEKLRVNHSIRTEATQLSSVLIQNQRVRNSNITRIDPKIARNLPTTAGGIEGLLKTMGAVSNNDMSSQYSVRGGNYDENLVYVNDIEIYRPFLVRAGQQEGLSFLNSDLVSSIMFSAGGFEARYGDKQSSVLDIKYKRPEKFAASASASLLGATVHAEGITKTGKFSYLAGARYKTNQYLLNALETKGAYKPVFLDFQSLLTYKISGKLDVSFLGYYSSNSYKLIPETRETNFGTYFNPLRLTIYFDGQEMDRFESKLGAVTFTYTASPRLQSKWIMSAYSSRESEAFDILAQYYIAALQNHPTENDTIEVFDSKGTGAFFNHARNKLNINVLNVENRYSFTKGRSVALWGIKYQREMIDDRINEWQMIDSSMYNLPYYPGIPGQSGNKTDFILKYHLKSSAHINSNRYSAFAQNTWNFTHDSTLFALNAGIRLQYWDYNEQLLISPRISLTVKPNWERDVTFKFSTGYYFQPPFYRELRNLQGEINDSVRLRAQKSLQFIVGADWVFNMWSRPFKLASELYYKHLTDQIPYQVDNVRIQYLGINGSKGYAYGLDVKINGEFVKGVESWASISYMKTAEDLYNDHYTLYYNAAGEAIRYGITKDTKVNDSAVIYPGYIPRPTDQRITFGMFFQDYLPMNPTFKVNLGVYFGSGLPTGAPDAPIYTHTHRLPTYKRVDIGLSKQIIGGEALLKKKGVMKGFRSLWVTLEVLNMLQAVNTVSYTYVKDVNGNQYGVPNYLTPRQLNLKLMAEF